MNCLTTFINPIYTKIITVTRHHDGTHLVTQRGHVKLFCFLFKITGMDRPKARRGLWTEKTMKLAVKAVLVDGLSNVKASRRHNVPLETLRRKVLIARAGGGVEKKLGRRTVLTVDEENELCDILTEMESRLYGLTPIDVRRIVFQYCSRNNIRNTFNVSKQLAGRYWFSGFIARHDNLAVRQAEAVSIQRAQGFNKPKVERFYAVLKTILFNDDGQRKIPPCSIFNVDESGFTICHKPGKIVASKGKHNVGILTSAEKGKNVTVVCCASATGDYVPPLLVFPRARLKPSLMDHAPSGSVGAANKTGWMQQETFSQWFDHFLQHIQPNSRPAPTLLIMDGHTSHTNNIDVVEKARRNNVQLLVLPSHCTHRLQPLDISFFKSLNSAYNSEVSSWLRHHPGRAVTEEEIGELFNAAYGKAASVRNAVAGFQKAGISPFRDDLFSDEDFAGSWSTDQPLESSADLQTSVKTGPETLTQALMAEAEVQMTQLESVEMSVVTSSGSSAQSSDEAAVVEVTPTQSVEMLTETRPGTSIQASVKEAEVQMTQGQAVEASAETERGSSKQSLVEAVEFDLTQAQLAETGPSMSTFASLPSAVVTNASETVKLTFKQLIGIPVQQEQQKRIRKRKVGHACVITESPYKKMLLEAREVKDAKETRKAERIRNREEKKLQAEVNKTLKKRSGNYV